VIRGSSCGRGAAAPDSGREPYAFINYAYQPEHQAQIVSWTSAVTPVAGVKQIFETTDPVAAKSQLIFPTAEYTKNCSTPISPPGDAQAKRRVEEAFSAAIGS
jgi:hypothetical protein